MSLRINNNIAAFNSHRNLVGTQGDMAKSLEKLSSGFRINRAADDAAGLAISEQLRTQTRGLNVASANAQNGISLIQTAEGALNETHAILQRMRELAVQGANDTLTAGDRDTIGAELTQLTAEIDRISSSTQFNTKGLLNGSLASGITLQVGANAGQVMTFSIATVNATALSVTGACVGTAALASTTLASISTAIERVSSVRSGLGAIQNRLEHTIKNLSVAAENLTASESRIRDTDMAREMVNFSRTQILSQAGTAMLAQANQVPQGVLSLLR